MRRYKIEIMLTVNVIDNMFARKSQEEKSYFNIIFTDFNDKKSIDELLLKGVFDIYNDLKK